MSRGNYAAFGNTSAKAGFNSSRLVSCFASPCPTSVHPRGGMITPLLSEYIKTNLPVKLPVKESKLFKLLRKNLRRIVSKDEIFAEVWGPSANGSEEASDWALDALIYRLRKHPFMKAHDYIIESHKKVGYTLIQT